MRAAAVQFSPEFGNPERNAARMAAQIEDLAAEGVSLVVFPEAALTGYCARSREEAAAIALPRDSEFVQVVVAAASERQMAVIFGFAEIESEKLYNTAMLAGPSGLRQPYRKVHLPFLGYDRYAVPGDSLDPCDTLVGRVGTLICYDVRFPEAARTLALKGAEIICVPTNWPSGAQASSDVLCPARAIENHVYVIAANRVGEENGFAFIGHSKIVDPFGQLLVSAGHESETVLIADIDPARSREKKIVKRPDEYETDLFADRRTDVYFSA
jgi:predicted amidohydrolase